MPTDNRLSVGIVGAGIVGRLLALKGDSLGWRVTLFDQGDASGKDSCSYRPPAMLSPVSELDVSEPIIANLGHDSLPLWKNIVAQIHSDTTEPLFFQQNGSLIVAHPHDRAEKTRFADSLASKAPAGSFRTVMQDELRHLEPQLDRAFTEGLFVPDEGQVDSRGALRGLAALLKQKNIACRYTTTAPNLSAKCITANDTNYNFDLVIDARGYGAKTDLPDLRAVRGEIIRIHAPDIHLNRPVRLLHPRYPLYVVPHADGEYVIGATSIESEDGSPVSVRSALELLSAAFTLNAAFGEARIIEMISGQRPAFPDNLPRIIATDGLLRVNGLYRHGYLISPKIAALACDYIASGKIDPSYASLFKAA